MMVSQTNNYILSQMIDVDIQLNQSYSGYIFYLSAGRRLAGIRLSLKLVFPWLLRVLYFNERTVTNLTLKITTVLDNSCKTPWHHN